MGLSRDEQETYISFPAFGQEAMIFSTDPVWIRKLKKLCEEHSENYQIKEIGKLNGEEISITVICQDKGLVTIKGERRKLSDEQREICTERFRAMREAKSEPISSTSTCEQMG